MEHYFMHAMSRDHHDGHEVEKWKSSSSFDSTEIRSSGGGFDCNICLDLVQEPVVTLCGHLYCWPCIYKWINLQTTVTPDDHRSEKQAPKCPVCKSEVTETTLVPLYGRGSSLKHLDDDGEDDGKKKKSCIPLRPRGPSGVAHQILVAATNDNNSLPQSQYDGGRRQNRGDVPPYPPPYYNNEFSSESHHRSISFAGSSTFHPVINMFGEMICARFSSSSNTTHHQPLFANPSSYSVAVTASARGRRQLVQADQSLSRLSFFFCCCLVLCLLLF